jgi:hypothetical protein
VQQSPATAVETIVQVTTRLATVLVFMFSSRRRALRRRSRQATSFTARRVRILRLD